MDSINTTNPVEKCDSPQQQIKDIAAGYSVAVSDELIQRAERKGLNLTEFIRLLKKYGPLVLEVIEGLTKDVSPPSDPTTY